MSVRAAAPAVSVLPVASRVLGHERIDERGPNAGFYERSTAAEICDYHRQVLEQQLVPSGRVRFFGQTDYRGPESDGHHLVALLTGEVTMLRVRRKVVDATYIQSEIPSRYSPLLEIEPGAR